MTFCLLKMIKSMNFYKSFFSSSSARQCIETFLTYQHKANENLFKAPLHQEYVVNLFISKQHLGVSKYKVFISQWHCSALLYSAVSFSFSWGGGEVGSIKWIIIFFLTLKLFIDHQYSTTNKPSIKTCSHIML